MMVVDPDKQNVQAMLEKQKGSLNVISVFGQLRTGKSFLMNSLSESQERAAALHLNAPLIPLLFTLRICPPPGVWCQQQPRQLYKGRTHQFSIP